MDKWMFYAITHRDHVILNPLNEAKLDELLQALHLSEGARLLDIACGKAEALCRAAEAYQVSGVGVDVSPHCISDATERARNRGVEEHLELVQLDGAEFSAPAESFDATLCIGASWIWNGLAGTLGALRRWTKPGGLVVVGEPYWIRDPAPEYLAAAELTAVSCSTHYGNVQIGLEAGLTPLRVIASSPDDWDRYESLQWNAAERYAAERPGDTEAEALVRRVRGERDTYLRWGRDTLGFAVYLFTRRASSDPAIRS